MILIGNSLENNGNNNPRCALIPSIPNGGTRSFNCGGMIGRLVNVVINGTDPGGALTLCEVQVFGELAAPSPSFSAVVMGRGIAVVESKLCWSDALLYCREFYWDLLSIRSEEEQREVETVLRTASFPLTDHIWLGLRRYLMGVTWFWMSGDSMNYTNWETTSVWQITSPCGSIEANGWTDLPCQDNLYFICLTNIQRDIKRVTYFSTTRPDQTQL
ncbi:snaclec agglucetin subunit beta-1-like [Micropterus dolomieu]|uniref:snaclec agglucetin subunit beta-1-like n=1 Tax=Micropterus dolomieu TaxID=147949 RepID=UPI001E8D5A3C|nr:snaclec agglucetin subunit beta-1-like [Micropterus dolomieu]